MGVIGRWRKKGRNQAKKEDGVKKDDERKKVRGMGEREKGLDAMIFLT